MGCPCEQCIRHSNTLGFRAGSASEAEIRKAYRRAAKAWHPDRFARDAVKRQEAEERFKQIQEAFRELIEHNPHGWAAPVETIASAPSPIRKAPRILFDGSYGCYSMPDVPPVAERIIERTLGRLDSALAILDLSGKDLSGQRNFSEFMLLTTHGVMLRSELHIVSLVSYADVREVRIIDRNLQPRSGWWQKLVAKMTNAGPKYALEIVKNDGTVFCSLDKQMNDGVKTVVYRFLLQQKEYIRTS
jgi:hypothetical protein